MPLEIRVADEESQATNSKIQADWNPLRRILFRFVFSFLVLYNLGVTLRLLSWIPFLSTAYASALHAFIPWVAKSVFHLSGMRTTYFRTGSGDTTLAYIEVLCFLVFAILATLVWSLIDRRRKEYVQLHAWLRLYTRYVLGYWMLVYGFAKLVPPTQFPTPYLARMLERYGDFSPMGVLWTFMGYSRTYTYCAGLAEATGGIFLLFRRTTTLGALVSAACMLNVLVLNLSYDVPVKLFSFLLLAMGIFLLAPNFGTLTSFFVGNHPAALAAIAPPLPRAGWMRVASHVLKTIVIAYLIYQTLARPYIQFQQSARKAVQPPIHGIYDVEEFARNGQQLPPLTTDADRWRNVVIENYVGSTMWTVRMMDDSLARYSAEFNRAKRTVTITPRDSKNKSTFTYSEPDPDHAVLQGTLGKDSINLKMRRIDESKFLIVSRGFHWITELSFNR